MRRWFCSLTLVASALFSPSLFPASIDSPSGRLKVEFSSESEGIVIRSSLDGEETIRRLTAALRFADGSAVGPEVATRSFKKWTEDRWIEPVVAQKASRLREHFNAFRWEFEGDAAFEIRVFDWGFAYRFLTERSGESTIENELMHIEFPAQTQCWFPSEKGMISHNEPLYSHLALDSIDETRLASLPLLMETSTGASVLFSEADLYDYPAMYVRGGDGDVIEAVFPAVPLKIEPSADVPDRDEVIVETAPYIAVTEGERSFPWRAFVISDNAGALLETDFVYLLSRPSELVETDWIRPGKVAWDWYNALNLTGVDFLTGPNQKTYQAYIDFASKYGLEYVILDEGWSISTTDVSQPNPEIDVPALVEYGNERGVGIILWSLWGPVSRDREALFDLYAKWGVCGVKIDFIQRSDQLMVNFYEETAASAARHRLLVDFHGSFKPAGLRRAYPNVISYEAVKGSENNKWSDVITPTHNVTLPFIRMAVGPMDYTPGIMNNQHPGGHYISFLRPVGMGTRAHEVAKYFIYESALQMLCDSPSAYERDPVTTRFIARMPTTWDETHALAGAVGEYVAVARRHGVDWYLGAMTNEAPRTLEVTLDCLPEGRYEAEIFRDGVNVNTHAEDYRVETRIIEAGETLQLEMGRGGGWSAIFRPLER